MDPERWSNKSPGDLSVVLPEILASDAGAAIHRAVAAFPAWAATPFDERAACLMQARNGIEAASERLALGIARETGKPLREARAELGSVVAKIELTLSDAARWLASESPSDNPHPAMVRRLARGPAAEIAPFNFPIHLGHGAAVAYLAAGNPVLFKPSPLAAAVAADYGGIMAAAFPDGVFQIVQGWGGAGRELALDPRVRSVCFTGSAAAGRALARELAEDLATDLALELGGKNASIIRADADLDLAAMAVADAGCLTAGQRCNSTSRVIVDQAVMDPFLDRLIAQLDRYRPGDPTDGETLLGPLISRAAVERYRRAIEWEAGEWMVDGGEPESVGGKTGYYVRPAAVLCPAIPEVIESPLWRQEVFAPVLMLMTSDGDEKALALHDSVEFGLSASVFTRSESAFRWFAERLRVGNVYGNLPTTLSPSTLPFGGLGGSGNRHPGGRGFVRFATDEQAVQWREGGFGG